jgi:hypothetical protein
MARGQLGLGTGKIKSMGSILYGTAGKSSRQIPAHFKDQLRKRDWKGKYAGECFCCGEKLKFDVAQMGHVRARSKGGSIDFSNLRLICGICNRGMHNKNMKAYMKKMYPDRYLKFFGKEENLGSKKDKPKKKSKRKSGGISYLARKRREWGLG